MTSTNNYNLQDSSFINYRNKNWIIRSVIKQVSIEQRAVYNLSHSKAK